MGRLKMIKWNKEKENYYLSEDNIIAKAKNIDNIPWSITKNIENSKLIEIKSVSSTKIAFLFKNKELYSYYGYIYPKQYYNKIKKEAGGIKSYHVNFDNNLAPLVLIGKNGYTYVIAPISDDHILHNEPRKFFDYFKLEKGDRVQVTSGFSYRNSLGTIDRKYTDDNLFDYWVNIDNAQVTAFKLKELTKVNIPKKTKEKTNNKKISKPVSVSNRTKTGISTVKKVVNVPRGFVKTRGATTAPRGYNLYSNNKSRFEPGRKIVLVKSKPVKVKSYKRNVKIDSKRQAKKPGKRKSAKGNTYYEYRANRSDKGKWL